MKVSLLEPPENFDPPKSGNSNNESAIEVVWVKVWTLKFRQENQRGLRASPALNVRASGACPPFQNRKMTRAMCGDHAKDKWSSEDLFHEGLVVLLGDFLVGNPDVIVHHFGIGFFLDQQIGGINGLPALRNGILEHGVVQFTFGH